MNDDTPPVASTPETPAILAAPVHIIASMLDHPSVYIGGPSTASIRRARRIWDTLVAEGYGINKKDGGDDG